MERLKLRWVQRARSIQVLVLPLMEYLKRQIILLSFGPSSGKNCFTLVFRRRALECAFGAITRESLMK